MLINHTPRGALLWPHDFTQKLVCSEGAPGLRVSPATDTGTEASPHGNQSQHPHQPACRCVMETGHAGAVSQSSLGRGVPPQHHL